MHDHDTTLNRLSELAKRGDRAHDKGSQIAEIIRAARRYHWVGLYQVTDTDIAAIAWTGTMAPAHPRFPRRRGLCGAAVESRGVVVVGDVRNDPRYLTTFSSTRAEIVAPVVDATGQVVGLIDVESEQLNAFGEEDRRFLESCASAILPLFK